MRVVAGSARGRRLRSPEGEATRPTSDRVREAVFNALFSLGVIEDSVVADLFAGSGALGIEALSRGASHAWFVENDRAALDVIRTNLESLGFAERATVLPTSVDAALAAGGLSDLDLVLADPPYAFDDWHRILGGLEPMLSPDAVVVVESGQPIELPAGWEKMRERTYGGTVITFAAPPVAAAARRPDDPPGADA